MTGIYLPLREKGERYYFFSPFLIKKVHSTTYTPCSHGPPALLFPLHERPAPVNIALAPDPWLVRAAHRRFCVMNSAEVPPLSNTAQKRAGAKIIVSVRISHFHYDKLPELLGFQVRTVDPRAILLTRKEEPEDVRAFPLDPLEQVLGSGCDSVPEDPAAEPALLTGLFIDIFLFHVYIQYSLHLEITLAAG